MSNASSVRAPILIRWAVVLATIGTCAQLMQLLAHPGHAHPDTIYALQLAAIALATYAWGLFPTAGSAVLSGLVLCGLGWSLVARATATPGITVVALGLLLGVAASRQRRRRRRVQRMQQTLDDFTEERTMKDQAMAAATQTRDALQKKLARYTQLQSIAESLSNLTTVSDIAQLTVDQTFALIGKSDVCLLFVVDQQRQELSLVASKKEEAIRAIRAKHGDQFDRYVLRTHRPLLVNDTRRDFRFTMAMAPERTVSSVIACPLMVGQSPEGVLRLDSARPGVYTQDDLRFLDILLDLVATALTNAKLFARTQQLAITDGLTGLTLRRPFLDQLSREAVRAARRREPISLVMLDVDHFKAYNDAHGHSAGDLVLKSVAQALRDVVGTGGVIARYGGEEFAVLLSRVDRARAAEIAERIRARVAEQTLATSRPVSRAKASPPAEGGVTVSLGVASFPDDAQVEVELIRIADQRLYAAKHAGRNRVVWS